MTTVFTSDSLDLKAITEAILAFVRDNGWNATLVISLPNIPAEVLEDSELKKGLSHWAVVEFIDQTVFFYDFVAGKEKRIGMWDQGEEGEMVACDTTIEIYPQEFHQKGEGAKLYLEEHIKFLESIA